MGFYIDYKHFTNQKRTDAETLLNSLTPSAALSINDLREEPFDILAHFEAILPHF